MLFGFIFAADEPGAPSGFAPALRELTDAIGIEPRRMYATMPKGTIGREKKFSWEWFSDSVIGAEDLGLWGGPVRKRSAVHEWRYGHKASMEELTVRFQPRYLSSDKRYQFPPRYYVIVPSSDEPEVRARRVAAIETFLVQVASPSHALHGAIGAATDADLAYNEVTMQPEPGFGPDGKPVRGRLWFDQGRWEEAWTRARRTYWTTILGPDLVAATGGIEAARSTGAARVEMRNGCLVVQSTSDVDDYLSPDWPERALPIRRWLWPHTIQNPFDDPDKPSV